MPTFGDEVFVNHWPKKCNRCNKTYDADAWEKLSYVGVQKGDPDIEVPDLEMRNCSCGSTLAITCPKDINIV